MIYWGLSQGWKEEGKCRSNDNLSHLLALKKESWVYRRAAVAGKPGAGLKKLIPNEGKNP